MCTPECLHREEAANLLMLLSRLGVRQTAAEVGLLAHRGHRGLQAMSLVETAVAATADDLMWLLNGTSKASKMARHSLKEAMTEFDHETVGAYAGLVVNAV